MSTWRDDVAEIKSAINDLDDSMDEIKSSISELRNTIDEMKTTMDELAQMIGVLMGQRSSASSSTALVALPPPGLVKGNGKGSGTENIMNKSKVT